MMKYVRWFLGLALLGVIGAAIWLWNPVPKNPSAEILSAGAAAYDAEIIRDNWGVPHIYGARDADVSFGLAYAHAEDDFETIQETVAATRGVLAHYRGADAAPTDYIVSLFGVWETLKRYETDVPADVRAIAESYAAGMNLYAAENPGATWPGLAPFTGQDVVAGFVFKTPFFYGLDGDLLELFGEDYQAELAMDPGPGRKAWHVRPKTMAERGSNAIAVSSQRAGDGVTRLMINSHQPLSGPVAWYEAHTVSEEGLDIMGGLFPGTPVVLHGFNRSIGWANTVSEQDLADVYLLERNPDDQMQYRLDGEWVDFEVSTAVINVKLLGPFAFKAKRQVLRSAHGPVVEAKHGTYALRYAGMGEIRQLEQYYRLNHAKDYDSFSEAMSMLALPSINYIYADRDDTIAFVHNGQYPNRIDGWDWSKVLPGDRADLIWDGYRPYAQVPKLVNPQSGLVWNSNNQPFAATDGPDNLKPGDFPESMGLQTNMTSRAMRMVELTGGNRLIDRERLLEIKFDKFYAQGSKAAKLVKEVLAMDWSDDPQMAAAAAHLAAWDLSMDETSRHAALGGLTTVREVTAKYTGVPAPTPSDAFREAVAYLETHYGRIDPEWGEINRLARGDESYPIGGGPDILRAVYPAEMRDDGTLHMTAGDTWIALVEWGPDGDVSAELINNYGSAVLDETSPHFGDQAPLFAAQKWRPALIERADVEAVATRTYRPGKASQSE
jgi:penicillin amidase/acyl-homoserine-lactone acylase